MLRRLHRRARLILANVGMLLCVHGNAAGAEHSYRYQGQAVELRLDQSRIAVYRIPDPLLEAGRLTVPMTLARFGVHPLWLENMVVPGWTSVDIRGMVRTDADVATLVEQIAHVEELDFVTPVFTDEFGPALITRDIFVGFRQEVTRASAKALLAAIEAGVVLDEDYQGIPGVYRVRSVSRNGFQTLAKANELAARKDVEFAEPNMIRTGREALTPNDPLFPQQWGLHNTGQAAGRPDVDMDAPEAWEQTVGDASVIVMVLDNGVQLNHPDLNLGPGIDATGQNSSGGPVSPCDNHGTAVAGCISGRIGNSLGGCGVAPNVKVAPARFNISNEPCNGTFVFEPAWFVSCLTFARSIGARVTVCSNTFAPSGLIDAAYIASRQAGIVHFAATGNSGSSHISYPASAPSVNAVGSINRDGHKSLFSQFGPGIDFSAPGEAIVTTDRTGTDGYVNGDYTARPDELNGTSYACPYAAGVAALIVSYYPSITAAGIEQRMREACAPLGATVGYNTTYGWGLVNAASSLNWLVIDLHPETGADSWAYGVHEGQQAGTTYTMEGYRASLWSGTAASWLDLHPGAASSSRINGTGDGQQVGAVAMGASRASLWSGTGKSWINLHPEGAIHSEALGAGNGEQAGYAFFPDGFHAGVWRGSAASWTDLAPPGAVSSGATAASGGQQSGAVTFVGLSRASLWNGTRASWVDLQPFGAIQSIAYALHNGHQAGYAEFADGVLRASLWSGTPESWVDLNPGPGFQSYAYGIRGGQQVGVTFVKDTIARASLWSGSAASWIDLGGFLPPGFEHSFATGIWTDLRSIYVSGYAYYGFGGIHAFLWIGRSPCQGDANADQVVDFIDLNLVLSEYGTKYDFVDLNLVLSVFGTACP